MPATRPEKHAASCTSAQVSIQLGKCNMSTAMWDSVQACQSTDLVEVPSEVKYRRTVAKDESTLALCINEGGCSGDADGLN